MSGLWKNQLTRIPVTRRKQTGFYLFERLLAISITGVLLSVCSASFHGWWLTRRAQSLQQQLESSVQNASLLARQLQHQLLLCGVSQRPGCDNNWSRGWQLWDADTQAVLRTYRMSGRLTLIWKGSLHRPVAFAPSGRPDGVQGGWHGSYQGHELFHRVMRRVL